MTRWLSRTPSKNSRPRSWPRPSRWVGPWGPVYGPTSLEIPRGRTYLVLLVAPGSGRTALLMALAGRMKPTGGTLEVMGETNVRTVFGRSALAGIEELDAVYESVTVADLVTEKLRWDAPWYRRVRRADGADLARVCAPVSGALPLPELHSYADELTELEALLLRVALANTTAPPLLVVGGIDQVAEDESRMELVRRLGRRRRTADRRHGLRQSRARRVGRSHPTTAGPEGWSVTMLSDRLWAPTLRYSRGVMPRVALVTIILLPLLYGAMYLWAFWNPFAAVDKVPVALVNTDRGAVVQGQELRAGDQVSDALLKSGQLDLHVMSAESAAALAADGTSYFSITLPEDFSEAIASAATPNPRQAELQFDFNDANNYLASVIGRTRRARSSTR